MANTTAESIHQIRTAVGRGDAQTAWSHIEPILRYPNSQQHSVDELAATWAFFEKVVVGLDFGSLRPLINTSRNDPDNTEALLELGKELLHHGLGPVAATPLYHASRSVSRKSCFIDCLYTNVQAIFDVSGRCGASLSPGLPPLPRQGCSAGTRGVPMPRV